MTNAAPPSASQDMTANSQTGEDAASSSADTIRSAQQALNDKGYKAGAVDGIMGPRTAAAVKSFQQAQGLQQSGKLDQQTLGALGVPQKTASTSSRSQ